MKSFNFLPSVVHCALAMIVYIVYMLLSAYVPGGTQDRLLKASLDGSVLVGEYGSR